MVTKTKRRQSRGSKKRFIGKPTGQIQERVQAVGPQRFGVIAVDCAVDCTRRDTKAMRSTTPMLRWADGSLVRQCNRKLCGAAMLVAENLIKCHPYYRGLSAFWLQQKVDP